MKKYWLIPHVHQEFSLDWSMFTVGLFRFDCMRKSLHLFNPSSTFQLLNWPPCESNFLLRFYNVAVEASISPAPHPISFCLCVCVYVYNYVDIVSWYIRELIGVFCERRDASERERRQFCLDHVSLFCATILCCSSQNWDFKLHYKSRSLKFDKNWRLFFGELSLICECHENVNDEDEVEKEGEKITKQNQIHWKMSRN